VNAKGATRGEVQGAYLLTAEGYHRERPWQLPPILCLGADCRSPRIFANLLVILAIWCGVAGLGVAKAILKLARRRSGLGEDTSRLDPMETLPEL
jgi:hypothetical protein